MENKTIVNFARKYFGNEPLTSLLDRMSFIRELAYYLQDKSSFFHWLTKNKEISNRAQELAKEIKEACNAIVNENDSTTKIVFTKNSKESGAKLEIFQKRGGIGGDPKINMSFILSDHCKEACKSNKRYKAECDKCVKDNSENLLTLSSVDKIEERIRSAINALKDFKETA